MAAALRARCLEFKHDFGTAIVVLSVSAPCDQKPRSVIVAQIAVASIRTQRHHSCAISTLCLGIHRILSKCHISEGSRGLAAATLAGRLKRLQQATLKWLQQGGRLKHSAVARGWVLLFWATPRIGRHEARDRHRNLSHMFSLKVVLGCCSSLLAYLVYRCASRRCSIHVLCPVEGERLLLRGIGRSRLSDSREIETHICE
jgi:hypothetical protein